MFLGVWAADERDLPCCADEEAEGPAVAELEALAKDPEAAGFGCMRAASGDADGRVLPG